MASVVSGTDSPAKDRKKSAHWTDNDTETLVNILLRYKDSGRTPDNGFRPEVWKEASLVLERSTFIGGPKTPDACKSRWQRIQRDFRAAKDIEGMPGFRWDRQEGRLIASPEAWKSAEAQMEPYKYSRIHLTCYDTLAILCPGEPVRSRQRTKGRSSHASTSDTSSMISLSVTGSTSHLDDIGQQQNYQSHSHNGTMPMGEIQNGMGGGMIWGTPGDEDGEGEYEHFSINDGHPFMGQKRMPFDPNIMNPSSHSMMPNQNQNQNQHQSLGNGHNHGASPPKKPRLESTRPPPQGLHANHPQLYAMTMPRSPTYHPAPQGQGQPQQQQTLLDPAVLTPGHAQQHHHHQQQQQQQQQQHGQHQMSHSQSHQTPHQIPHHPNQNQTPHLMINTQSQPQNGNQNQSSQSGTGNDLNGTGNSTSSSSMTPGSANMTHSQSHMHRPTVHNNTPLHHDHQNHSQHHLPPPTINSNSNSQPHTPTSVPLGPTETYVGSPAPSAPSTGLAAEVQYAGLSDAQRRTQAILQLQQELEMRDEDMVEVMAEFENNIAAADTYLAIKKDQLRRMYLRTIVQRRRQGG